MPSGRKYTRVELGEVAPRFLQFCFIMSAMIFLLTLLAGYLSPLDTAELIIFVITIFVSLCVMIASGIAIRILRKQAAARRKAKQDAIRADRPSGKTLDDWLEAEDTKKEADR